MKYLLISMLLIFGSSVSGSQLMAVVPKAAAVAAKGGSHHPSGKRHLPGHGNGGGPVIIGKLKEKVGV